MTSDSTQEVPQENIVAEVEMKDGRFLTIIHRDDGFYEARMGDEIVQPNHDAEGIMRYLCHILQNYQYKASSMKL